MTERQVDLQKLAQELSDSELINLAEKLRGHLTPEVINSEKQTQSFVACNPNYCVVVRPLEE
ncbi:hypothetical protein [Kitasatospora sp. NPDC088351]|uniref:hypothetical protein n=1 Tax=unclassified Kitasatospora TaxID=2633591 RepID=UPI0034288750